MPEQNVGSWSETEAMRRALCKALAIRPDTSWEDAIEDARNAGIVRDAEYRAHDRISDRNEVLSSLLRGMARRVVTYRRQLNALAVSPREDRTQILADLAPILSDTLDDIRVAVGMPADTSEPWMITDAVRRLVADSPRAYLESAATYWQARAERYAEVLRQVSDSFRTATFSDYLPPEPPVGAEVRNSRDAVVWARRDDGWHCALNVACKNCPTDWEEAWERTGRPFSVVLPAAALAGTATTPHPAPRFVLHHHKTGQDLGHEYATVSAAASAAAHLNKCMGFEAVTVTMLEPVADPPLLGTWADPEFREHQDHKHPAAGCGYCPDENEEGT